MLKSKGRYSYAIFFVQLQQAEMEQLHQKEANLTALAAIGPRKQQLLDIHDSSSMVIAVMIQ